MKFVSLAASFHPLPNHLLITIISFKRSQLLCFLVLSDFSSFNSLPSLSRGELNKGSSFSCFLVLFSFQDAVPIACPFRSFVRPFRATAYLLYHISLRLSSLFSKVFSKTFFPSLCSLRCSVISLFVTTPLSNSRLASQ